MIKMGRRNKGGQGARKKGLEEGRMKSGRIEEEMKEEHKVMRCD